MTTSKPVFIRPQYRLYVDEVGNPGLTASTDPVERYLSLTGVACSFEYVRDTLAPEMEDLKRQYFAPHPDDPIVFHRKELLQKLWPFQALKDPEQEALFNEDLLKKLSDWEYTVFTVIIDKLEHQARYKVWRYDPYHYCLHVLLERYVMWLEKHEVVGDVLAESRGGKEDRRLKDSFERIYENGTSFVSAERVASRLTSRQLKVKSKANNIAGLQVADLIAHPSYKAALARRNNQALPDNFGGRIATILEHQKYDRDERGKIEGWGWKWLP